MDQGPTSLISVLHRLAVSMAIGLIRCWQAARAGQLRRCRFEPSCSHYAIDAFRAWGFGQGLFRGVLRILKCHPWHAGGWDPVPHQSSSTQGSEGFQRR